MPKTPDFKYDRDIGDLLSGQRKPATIPDTGWNLVGIAQEWEIPFENSWGNVGGGEAPARHYLSDDGETRLDGKVDGGTDNTVIYTLPEEMRPEYNKSYVCVTEDADGNRGIGIVDVLTDGSVVFIGAFEGVISGSGGGSSIDGGSP